eukprot:UN24544
MQVFCESNILFQKRLSLGSIFWLKCHMAPFLLNTPLDSTIMFIGPSITF